MNDHQKLFSAVADYDRKQSTKKGYNPYALAHYAKALQNVDRYVALGHPLRDAIVNCFRERLCDTLLKAVGLPLMSKEEAKYGPSIRLPELPDVD